MPTFLSKEEVYRLIQRELPEDVYPDGPASGYFSTANSDADAKVISDLYVNLSEIYDNKFPTHITEDRIADWERKVFGAYLGGSYTLQQRRDIILAFLREKRSISLVDVSAAIRAFLLDRFAVPSGNVQIIEWCNASGGWVLDVSELGYSTWLNGANLLQAYGPLLCDSEPSDFGLTEEEWAAMQRDAYTYEVIILEPSILTEEEEAELDIFISKIEKAGSRHVITAPFLPTIIDDLVAWYDVTLGVVDAGGGLASQWTDQSENGYNATAIVTERPSIVTAELNGLNVLRFDGGNDRFTMPSIISDKGQWSLFAVVKSTSPAQFDAIIASNTSVANQLGFEIGASANRIDVFKNAVGAQAATPAASFASGTWYIVEAQYNGTTLNVYINGQLLGTATESGHLLAAVNRIGHGSGYNFWHGDMAALVIYERGLTDDEQSRVRGYLNTRYDIF